MRYAVIADGMCVNIVKAEPEFAESMGWVPLPDGFGIGDACTDGGFSHLPPLEAPADDADADVEADADAPGMPADADL